MKLLTKDELKVVLKEGWPDCPPMVERKFRGESGYQDLWERYMAYAKTPEGLVFVRYKTACPNCGKEAINGVGSRYCPNCGKKMCPAR